MQAKIQFLALLYMNTGIQSKAIEICYSSSHQSHQSLDHQNEPLVYLSTSSAFKEHKRCLSIQKHRTYIALFCFSWSESNAQNRGDPQAALFILGAPDKEPKFHPAFTLPSQEPLRCGWRHKVLKRVLLSAETINNTAGMLGGGETQTFDADKERGIVLSAALIHCSRLLVVFIYST